MNLPFIHKKKTGITPPKPKLQSSTQHRKPTLSIKGIVKAPQWHFKPQENPYVGIVVDDVKRLFRIDQKSKMDKQAHDDFLEQHFGKGK